jgi:hypothetical protein
LGSVGTGKIFSGALTIAELVKLNAYTSGGLVFYAVDILIGVAALCAAGFLLARRQWVVRVLPPLAFGILGWEMCQLFFGMLVSQSLAPKALLIYSAYLLALLIAAVETLSSKVTQYVTARNSEHTPGA